MIETTVHNPERLETVRADSQGRVNLGVKFADREVELIVVRSEPLPPEETGMQHTIEDGAAIGRERTGLLFVRTFGIATEYLQDDHDATIEDGTVKPTTVRPADVNWSHGRLVDPGNVARFVFEEHGDSAEEFSAKLTAEPTGIDRDADTFDSPVYRFENRHGDSSAIAVEYVEQVEDVYGYDPAEHPEYVRVHPSDAPMPVMFCDPEGETSLLLAPMVEP